MMRRALFYAGEMFHGHQPLASLTGRIEINVSARNIGRHVAIYEFYIGKQRFIRLFSDFARPENFVASRDEASLRISAASRIDHAP